MIVQAYFRVHFTAGGNPEEHWVEVEHQDKLKPYIDEYLTEYKISRLDIEIKPRHENVI